MEGMKMDNFNKSQQCNAIPFHCIYLASGVSAYLIAHWCPLLILKDISYSSHGIFSPQLGVMEMLKACGYIFLCPPSRVCCTVVSICQFYSIATELSNTVCQSTGGTTVTGTEYRAGRTIMGSIICTLETWFSISCLMLTLSHDHWQVSSFPWPWFPQLMKSLDKMLSRVSLSSYML